MAGQDPHGRFIDIGIAFSPVDLDTANGATGKRINMGMHRGVLFVCQLSVGAVDDVTFDVQQHTAYTGGTSKDLDADPSTGVVGSKGVTYYDIKAEALLDNDERWSRVTQAAASEVTLAGATYGDKQVTIKIPIFSDQLGEGYTHMSVNVATTTSTAHLAGGLYIPFDLRYQRAPDKLDNLLRPGVANA